MKAYRIQVLKTSATLMFGALSFAAAAPVMAQQLVAVTQIVEHPALDAVRKGVKDGLEERGFVDGKNIRWQFQSAQGSPVTAAQIAQKFAGDDPAVIVAISTPSAQTVVAANKKAPVVFGAVTDAISTKLVTNLDKPGGNVTGILAFPPVAAVLDLTTEITPGAKRLGVIYNAGEANSVAILAALRVAAKQRNLTLVETTVAKSGDVGPAAESLVGKIDAIVVAGDNTVTSALESVARVSATEKLPMICADPSSVSRGCNAGLGYDWYFMGKAVAEYAAEVLKGKPVGDLPVRTPQQMQLVVGAKSSAAIGLQIPESVLKRASNVLR